MVYDCTNRESFNNLKANWLRELNAIAPESMLKFVVGNKVDLLEEMEDAKDNSRDSNGNMSMSNQIVTDKMLREFAMSKKAESMKISARKN